MSFDDGEIHTVEKISVLNGRTVNIAITASPLRDPYGEIVAGIELVRDVTERKQIEQEIVNLNADLARRAGELSLINADLEAFSYSLGHDLRAPLTVITAAGQALLDEYAPGIDESGRFFLESIVKAGERIDEILDAMLLLSRVSRAEMELDQVDLSELALEVVDELRHLEPERRMTAVVQPGVSARGDRKLLKTALENLIGNAWKYSGKTADPCVEFGAEEVEGERVFFVRDNGAGFDMGQAEQLFTPFKRLRGSEDFPGTGIGLATVRRIVSRHGGRIWAEAAPGRGATFRFALPDR